MAMRRVGGAILSFAVSVAVGACVATPQSSAPSPAPPVAVTDLESLVGNWEGLGQGPSSGSALGRHTANWVELTIKEDGTYEARSYREIGVFRGMGRRALSDNVVHWKSDRSRGVLYLICGQGASASSGYRGS
jgi:hypothetical protein